MSSIYDDSVLIQVPSGYGVGKLYSVIPNTPVGDFDVTRSSWTTRVNKYGYIENVVANVPRLNYDSGVVCPYLLTEAASTNLITYPISFSNSYWTKSGASVTSGFEAPKVLPITGSDLLSGWDFTNGWTASGTATIDDNNSFTTTSNAFIYKNYLTVGTYYKIRIAGNTTATALRLTNATASVVYGNLDLSGTFDETIYIQAYINGGVGLYHSSAGTSDITTLEVEEITTCSWSGGGFEKEAFKLVEDTSNGSHTVRKTSGLTITSGVDVTFSVYAKKGERNWIAFSNNYGGGLSGWFDLENGVWGQVNNATANSKELANGWYRLSLTATSSGTSAKVRIYATTSDGNYSYQGDGTSGIYIAYAQLEESSYASSLMLPANSVEGSTTSRVADEITGAGDASLFTPVNASGVLYLEVAANSDDGTNRGIGMTDSTTLNRFHISYTATTNQIYAEMRVGSGVADLYYTLTDETEFSKIAFRWAENDFSLWVDGVEVDTDTSGSTFPASTLSEVVFNNGSGSNSFYGKTKALGVFDYLYDDQMELLTGDSYATYEALAMAEDYIIL